jgi:glycosyltransferase involved in cell wall biosynthesis
VGRPLRIGLYSPFLGSTIGGGEKYLCVTAGAVRDGFPEAEVELLTPVPVDVDRYERMLGVDLRGIHFRAVNSGRGGVKGRLNRIPVLRRYRDLAVSAQAVRLTASYDLLISMVYVLPAFSRARRGVILCQFPYELEPAPRYRGLTAIAHRLYVAQYSFLCRRLLGAGIDDFQEVICQSEYVRQWVKRLWKRDAVVINPPIDVPDEEPDWSAKRNVILSVGRFFAAGHNKRHDVMVECFRRLCDGGLEGWELHLAGSVHRSSPADVEYFERVQARAEGYPVCLHPDAPLDTVRELYRQASIYWHAAGFGVDGDARPAELEHFGMTTAEAMAHGAVPVVIAMGGQPEVVEEEVSGLLWRDTSELEAKTLGLAGDAQRRRSMGERARRASLRFSRARFEGAVVEELRSHVLWTRANAEG